MSVENLALDWAGGGPVGVSAKMLEDNIGSIVDEWADYPEHRQECISALLQAMKMLSFRRVIELVALHGIESQPRRRSMCVLIVELTHRSPDDPDP